MFGAILAVIVRRAVLRIDTSGLSPGAVSLTLVNDGYEEHISLDVELGSTKSPKVTRKIHATPRETVKQELALTLLATFADPNSSSLFNLVFYAIGISKESVTYLYERLPLKIKELMQVCFDHGLNGRDTDTCVKAIAINLLGPATPVVTIEISKPADLLRMMRTADSAHIYVAGGIFHFNALFKHSKAFPAPRVYFMKSKDLLVISKIGTYLQNHGITLPPVHDGHLATLLDDNDYSNRYKTWHARWEENAAPFKRLLDGRVKNTTVEKGMWFSSGGGCLVCGNRTELMSTTTLIAKSGLMIGLQLCERHEDEAKNHTSLLNYIAKKMGIPAPLLVDAKVHHHDNRTITMSCEAIKVELDCAIEVKEKTITALRKSGFRIILRQDSLSDYAYNIQDPTKKQISRIDSANHHKVAYGPDHIHRSLTKSKKNKVESSFTYGFAVADLKIIRKLVEDAEANWEATTVDTKGSSDNNSESE